jgi:selenocysteine-specific elongation factor
MIVGTAGHIDHGKTALVRALTGVDTDRLKEEKARGISINLGFAYVPAADGSVMGFIDVPGHERFVHNMLAGATGIDLVLLVVAADDGVMPQTREHLAIVDLLGVRRSLVALTKVDLVTPERRAEARAEIATVIAGTTLDGAEIVDVSTVSGEGVADLRAALDLESAALSERARSGRFRLAVDRSFTLAGAGTVVTGTVLSGAVSIGDGVLISPLGKPARVRSIHAQNRPAERGQAGERCALNLTGEGVTKDAIRRGDVVLDPTLHAPAIRVDARLRVLASEAKAIGQWLPVRFHSGATEVGGRIVPLGDAPLAPGTEGWVQLVLEHPVAAAAGDHFIVRDTSAQRTIGGGTLVDLRAPARKRRTPERIAQITALAEADAGDALGLYLGGSPGFIDLAGFIRDRALGDDEAATIVERLSLVRLAGHHTVYAMAADGWTSLRRSVHDTLGAFHGQNPDMQGMGRERLRLALEPRLPEPAFAAALQQLASLGDVAIDGAWVRLPSLQAHLTPDNEALWRRIQPLIAGTERFRPPRVRDIAGILGVPESNTRKLLKLASRMGRVDEIAHDHFFLRATVAEMVALARDLSASAPDGQFTAAQLRDRIDSGRKVAIQILDFFDRHGVTSRRGDLRRINVHRLDLFGAPPAAVQPSHATESHGRASSPVGRPDFKSGKGRETVLGGFDSHSLPPTSRPPTSKDAPMGSPPPRPATPKRGVR